jgi:hypothetical protein
MMIGYEGHQFSGDFYNVSESLFFSSRPMNGHRDSPVQAPHYGSPVHAQMTCNTIRIHPQLRKAKGLLGDSLINRRHLKVGEGDLEGHLPLGSNSLRPCPPSFAPHRNSTPEVSELPPPPRLRRTRRMASHPPAKGAAGRGQLLPSSGGHSSPDPPTDQEWPPWQECQGCLVTR